MALVRCDFFSDALGLSTSMTVILPEATEGQIGMTGVVRAAEAPVLYLLHGLSDDDSIWLRRTSIERYVAPLGLAVVMPAVSRSFYTDEEFGLRYWTFICEELPAKVESLFRISGRREDRFVAGLSMGGYGAFKLALRQPQRFAAAASLSGVLDISRRLRDYDDPGDRRLVQRLFGDSPVGADDDLLELLKTAEGLPALYLTCGTEDELVGDNRTFAAACARHGIALTTDFQPGIHEWDYWDRTIQDVLDWLPLPTR